MAGVVIIGAGQAGFQCAESLRQEGFEGTITLIGEELHPPYQRPPLSKAYLLGETDRERILYRPPAFYEQQKIDLRLGVRATAIDRAGRKLMLSTGEHLPYDALVLATGARPRRLSLPGADLAGVFYLRTLDDVDAIEARLQRAANVVVIGAGFIGLEFAAVASKLGKEVHVLEALDRVMARVLPAELSSFFEDLHRSQGVEILCQAAAVEMEGRDGAVAAVKLADGRRLDADLVVVGIGVVPNVELAEAAGLACDNGILVDANGRTDDAAIYAVGDCAAYAHPFIGRPIRLESVQNAIDQARAAAAAICGHDKPYTAVPWFWSDQYDVKLQMAGLSLDADRHVVRGDPASGRFSILHFLDGRLRAVAAVNKPADYLQCRKLLEVGLSPTPEEAADPSFALKSLLK